MAPRPSAPSDQDPLPYQGDKRFARRAKMVYEFESADVLQPIMYPFMARSFREAGFQWATQFAYDPMALAPYNTEYQTHYLSLACTPAKDLSLLVLDRPATLSEPLRVDIESVALH